MKNRRIGQYVGGLANRAKLANPLVQHTRIRESGLTLQSVMVIIKILFQHNLILMTKA
jgi:hypothetical protein